jgi:GNAT superfamily N-acetyltransferase
MRGEKKRAKVMFARVQDVGRAWEIVEEYNEAVGVVERDDRASFLEYFRRPGALWLAELDETIVGCVALRPLELRDEAACEVKRLYVRPERRSAGIAAALMDAVEQYATDEGFQFIYLDTFEALAAAVRFYSNRGYAPVDRYNDNPQATIFMRLDLRVASGRKQ